MHKEIFPNTNVIAYIREYSFDDRDTPAEAWGDVLTALKRLGSWTTPVFDNEITQKAVDCMGWQCLCESTNVEADRAHFMKMYEQLLSREKKNKLNGIL